MSSGAKTPSFSPGVKPHQVIGQAFRELSFGIPRDDAKNYVLKYILGRGSFGDVWRASRHTNGRTDDVVIKFVDAYNGGQGLNHYTLSEIAYPLVLDHQNIVKYESIIGPVNISELNFINEEDERTFKIKYERYESNAIVVGMVMPMADGDIHSLISRSSDQAKNPNIINMCYQLVDALCYMTSHNIIHRDIKDTNILYYKCEGSNDYKLMYADFGLSINRSCYHDFMNSNVYTIYFRPPEILILPESAENYGLYDSTADVWALGCVLYMMYVGKYLFRAENQYDILKQQLSYLGPPIDDKSQFYQLFNSLNRKTGGQLSKIVKLSGFSNPINHISDKIFVDLLEKMLVMNPNQRASIFEIRDHPFFEPIRRVVHSKCYKQLNSEHIGCAMRERLFERNLTFDRFSPSQVDATEYRSFINKIARWMMDIMFDIVLFEQRYRPGLWIYDRRIIAAYFVALQILFRAVQTLDLTIPAGVNTLINFIPTIRRITDLDKGKIRSIVNSVIITGNDKEVLLKIYNTMDKANPLRHVLRNLTNIYTATPEDRRILEKFLYTQTDADTQSIQKVIDERVLNGADLQNIQKLIENYTFSDVDMGIIRNLEHVIFPIRFLKSGVEKLLEIEGLSQAERQTLQKYIGTPHVGLNYTRLFRKMYHMLEPISRGINVLKFIVADNLTRFKINLQKYAIVAIYTAGRVYDISSIYYIDNVFKYIKGKLHHADALEIQYEMLDTIDYDVLARTPFDQIQGYIHDSSSQIIHWAGSLLAHISKLPYYFELNGRYQYRRNLAINCYALIYIAVKHSLPITWEPINSFVIEGIINLVNRSLNKRKWSALQTRFSMIGLRKRTFIKKYGSEMDFVGIDLDYIFWRTIVENYNKLTANTYFSQGILLTENREIKDPFAIELAKESKSQILAYYVSKRDYVSNLNYIQTHRPNFYDFVIVDPGQPVHNEDILRSLDIIRVGLKLLKPQGYLLTRALPRAALISSSLSALENNIDYQRLSRQIYSGEVEPTKSNESYQNIAKLREERDRLIRNELNSRMKLYGDGDAKMAYIVIEYMDTHASSLGYVPNKYIRPDKTATTSYVGILRK